MGDRTYKEETRMNTEIHTVGMAMIAQTVIRYAAYIAIAWLALSFADGWVQAWIGAAHG
jgi:hypothetical protein